MKLLFLSCKKLHTKLVHRSTRPSSDFGSFVSMGQRGETVEYSKVTAVFTCVEKKDEYNPEASEIAADVIVKNLKEMPFKTVVVVPFVHLTRDISSPKYAYRVIKEVRRRLTSCGFPEKDFQFGWHQNLTLDFLSGNGTIKFERI